MAGPVLAECRCWQSVGVGMAGVGRVSLLANPKEELRQAQAHPREPQNRTKIPSPSEKLNQTLRQTMTSPSADFNNTPGKARKEPRSP